jgi:hypothetical protein
MSKTSEQIKDLAQPLLDDGEEIVAALVASPRGSQTATQVGVVGAIGRNWSRKHVGAAESTGLEVHRNMVVALTPSRLVTMRVTISMMGAIKEIQEISSSVPLGAIGAVESKWNVLTITVHGTAIKLEAHPGRSKEFAMSFAELTAASY